MTTGAKKDPMTPAQCFERDTKNHVLTICHDDGVYRHLRFAQPGTYCYSFNIITWPGALAINGDMGCYVFERLHDMFQFFREDRVNLSYWAEKVEARDRDGIKEFCEKTFNRAIMERLIEWIRWNKDDTTKEERRELWESVVSDVIHADSGAERKQIAAHDFRHEIAGKTFEFNDFFETNVEKYTFRFVWACHAIQWGIAQYDKAKDAAGAKQ